MPVYPPSIPNQGRRVLIVTRDAAASLAAAMLALTCSASGSIGSLASGTSGSGDAGAGGTPALEADAATPGEGGRPADSDGAMETQSPIVADGTGCSYSWEPTDSKISDILVRDYQLEPGAREVVIVHKEQPDPSGLQADQLQQSYEIQRCTIARINALGGQVLEVFWLISGMAAVLTFEQAVDIAGLTNVQHVDPEEGGSPP